MRLDVYNHILPAAYFERLRDMLPDPRVAELWKRLPALHDLDAHLRLMDGFDDYCQVLSLSNPPIEMLAGPEETPALARLANDGMAELCRRYPDRFPAFTASMPMNNPDAAVAEAERAITELDARGIQIFTNVLGKPLSEPEFFPLFETLARHDLPVWIHPIRGPNTPDYASETASRDEIWFTFGWPYETSAMMTRLVFSGLFDKLPGIKIITHHMGAMIPYFQAKIGVGFEQIMAGPGARNPLAERAGLEKEPLDYFRMFYADTALNGAADPTRLGLSFFGEDRCLFATDAPFDPEGGAMFIRETIRVLEDLDVEKSVRAKLYADNTRRLLKLDRAGRRPDQPLATRSSSSNTAGASAATSRSAS